VGDCKSLEIKNARHTHITNEKKYEGFGGRPLVGGRPGARAPRSPLNPALEPLEILGKLRQHAKEMYFVHEF